MAVVINEFEVVNEQAAPPAQPAASAKPAAPVDLERALAAIRVREQRVRTY
jgi:hypothetical protein